MNEAKHTPGPWAVSKGYDGSISVSATRAYRINNISAGTPIICDVYQHPEFNSFSGAANARLIAAAPELLEALKWYENQAKEMGKAAIHSDSKRILELMKEIAVDYGELARAAIAKATGGAA